MLNMKIDVGLIKLDLMEKETGMNLGWIYGRGISIDVFLILLWPTVDKVRWTFPSPRLYSIVVQLRRQASFSQASESNCQAFFQTNLISPFHRGLCEPSKWYNIFQQRFQFL